MLLDIALTAGPEVVEALHGETARLPCRADPAADGSEQPVLLQWYRGTRLIYSVDSENVPLVQARHTVHSGAREERRLHFSVGRRPYRLSLGQVRPDDEDVYFCLVAFASGASINASVHLVVVGECPLSPDVDRGLLLLSWLSPPDSQSAALMNQLGTPVG
ncbi:hypothetical protein HPB48_005225 [Haemaphysalis longicornis]|uniref:Ig-like domain-containing protein n=1 Tax=Haemaphysalis longicornis TaxID=44386 RepID=A0A9J6FGA0_HAELO|nr:hypothetical protein HPB48_005225 [Haemaphysalis longicornis]